MATKNITIPDIGGATDVVVIEVLIKVGDTIKVEQSILTLESDKATLEVPSTDSGVVKELKVKTGDHVSSGTVILVLDATGDSKEAPKAQTAEQPQAASAKMTDKATTTESSTSQPDKTSATEKSPTVEAQAIKAPLEGEVQEVHAGPAVRRIAREFGVNLNDISPTGPKSRILKEDIQGYVKLRLSQVSNTTINSGIGLPSAPVVDFSKFGATEESPLSRIKKLTGKNLHRNWLLVPHVTQFGEADITDLEDFRQTQKVTLEKQGIKLTPLVFIMKAIVACLKAYPQFNSSLDGSGEKLILKNYFHIGVAVDTPDGLVVPVIRDVDKKGLQELAKELAAISDKARKKQLSSQDMQGGCISISSLGGIGGTAFTPIVNVPEVAILGVSKAAYKPIYQQGEFVPRLMLPLSLSYDHRVIDGADGARFITSLSQGLSDIRNLLL